MFCLSSSCVFCTLCYQCLGIAHSWLFFRFSLSLFILKLYVSDIFYLSYFPYWVQNGFRSMQEQRKGQRIQSMRKIDVILVEHYMKWTLLSGLKVGNHYKIMEKSFNFRNKLETGKWSIQYTHSAFKHILLVFLEKMLREKTKKSCCVLINIKSFVWINSIKFYFAKNI